MRALRISFYRGQPADQPHRSSINGLRFLRGRFVNLAWEVVPFASSEAGTQENEREAYGKGRLTDGSAGDLQGGQWRNKPGAPLSEANVEWVALLWDRPRSIAAVGLVNAFAKTLAIDSFTGAGNVHPLTAPPADWREEARAAAPVPWRPMLSDFFVPFAAPTESRCVRVRFIEGLTRENPDVEYHTKGEPIHARLGELLALQDLGNATLAVALRAEPVEFEARVSDNRGQQAAPAPGKVTVDGDLADWDKSGGIFMCQDTSALLDRAAAWGNVMYDAEALYVGIDCTDDTPLANRHDPQSEPVPGDLRLLITAQGEPLAPLAVLYRHRGPGAPAEGKVTFSSPWRSAVVDQVLRLDSAQVAVKPDAAQRRYAVEAAVPWTDLGLTPQAGLRLGADLGVLFGDAAGETTIERSYWSNHSVNFTSDVPGEAMLYPNFWGTVELK